MHRSLLLATLGAIACTRLPVSLDDEADVTSSESSSTTEEDEGEASTDESTTDDDVSTDGPLFVPIHDLLPGPCDILEQDCPEGEKCVPGSSDDSFWDTYECVPIMGDQHPGEPCNWDYFGTNTDDCDANSYCWNVLEIDNLFVGECAGFCTGSDDNLVCPEGMFCLVAGSFSPLLCLPIPDCDPLLQDCAAGLGCFWLLSYFDCVWTDGGLPTGAPCRHFNDCAPGNFCADSSTLPSCEAQSCCTNYCDLDLGDMQCVDPATACVPFFEVGDAPPDHEDVGICILPP